MRRRVALRALVSTPPLALVCFAISAAGAGAAAPTGTRIVTPKPLIPRGATQLGSVSPTATVSGAVVLQPRDDAALTSFIAQVTDKRSPLFHHYLTPGSFAGRFGPTAATIAAVKSQLQASGLTVTGVTRDGLLVHFQAPASRVESTFGTGLERYRLADGSLARARTAPVRVPATIAQDVTAVVGLDTTMKLRSSGIVHAPMSARGSDVAARAATFTHPAGSPTPCADATGAARNFGGLTDDQIANAYGAFGLYGAGDTGAGQHIAVYELEPFAMSDLNTFDTCYFGATRATAMLGRVAVKNVDGGQTAGTGLGEAILDVEDVSAFAPGANIDVYEGPNNTFGALDTYAQIVNDDVDSVVTTSWGICEQALQQGSPGVQQAENIIFQQAAAQGQTVFSAAGDEGSNDCNAFQTTAPVKPVLSVEDPSSQPYVVSAGGTTMDNATQPASERVWNDGAAWGSAGGGISEAWPMPAWQLDSHVPGVNDQSAVSAAKTFEAADLGNVGYAFCASDNAIGSAEDGCREVPDVSANADEFTGSITVFIDGFGGWSTYGGTSSAAPLWAAMLADVNASATCKSNTMTQDGVGFVSPLLYSVASNPTAYAASFNDIKVGNNDLFGDSKLFQATTGYDMASGLGTPQLTQPGGGAGLAFYLCSQAAASTRPTVTDLSPAVGFSSSPTTVTITGTNFEQNGAPDVKNIQVGGVELPSGVGAFTVTGPTTITANIPPGSFFVPSNDTTDGAGRAQVTVTLDDGETSAVNLNSWFTFVDDNGSSQPRPTVTSVHTYAGPDAGGNTVLVYGTGFTGATGVTFGGVAAPAFSADPSGTQIRVTVPAFQSGTTNCVQDGSSFDPSENATNDICQTQVEVTTPNGTSTDATVLPLYEGAFSVADTGVIPAPSGQEPAPASTEYDYVPTPTITSISTSQGPGSLASEEGGSVVTIRGTGFNLATLDWVNFGNPTQASSQQYSSLVSVTGTKIEIQAPGFEDVTVRPATLPVTIQTIAGLSNSTNATYAGLPTVSAVEATSGPTAGASAGPDTGGTPIEIDGSGLANQALAVTFNDVATPFSFGTQYNFTAASDTKLTTTTVGQNPGVVDTQVCTVTDCSSATSSDNDLSDVFILYPPGDPKIDSISRSSGPANGGTHLTITGENLGCVTNISFGKVVAVDASNAQALLDCGSTSTVDVTAPAGRPGTVPVTLETVESDATGTPAATTSFTYTKPFSLKVHRSGGGSGKVTSSPAGIKCPRTCAHAFAFGKTVTLKAKASKDSAFAGWSGACRGKTVCKLKIGGPFTETARFTRRRHKH